MSRSEKYAYSPLTDSEIRLVTFNQAKKGELEASIQHVTLNSDDPIKYTALSYCWGDPSTRVDVPCDGKVLSITTSLHEALCEIVEVSPHKTLWIDQICIDQEDLFDKSRQVSKMNVIYDKAETVLIWLGPETESASKAVDFVKRVGEIALPDTTDMFRWDHYVDDEEHEATKLEKVEKYTVEKSNELGISFDDLESWDAFSEFFDKPWYQRMWTVQEIIQARKAFVVYGSYTLQWELVSAAAKWFVYKAEAIHSRHSRGVGGMWLVNQMVSIPWRAKMGSEYHPQLFGQKMRPTCKWGLRDLLEELRPRLASDPRDKVYSVVGISELDGGFGDDKQIAVDYSLSVKDVFTNAADIILRTDFSDGVDLIWSARQPSNELGWPSWVPDWRQRTGQGCEWEIGKPFKINSHRNGRYKYIPTDDPYALAVQGKIIGKVTYRSQYCHFGELFQSSGLREVYQDCMQRLDTYPTGEDVKQAFGLTILGGILSKGLKEKEISMERYVETYMDFFDVTQMPQATPEDRAVRDEALEKFYKLGYSAEWLLAILDAYCERRFFLTDTSYMGLANHKVTEGDVIAILFGFRWPCVLRPKAEDNGKDFEFIGEAYVHGMMGGEGVQGLAKDESVEGDGCYVGDLFLLK
ncbi:unnamed protein product [Clonostachys chloroleuca]|uniref:Heterokaryon incompatibility domain-containing protein n=1 Tax=Clonostachys chloroleuca TaxID=1926264 RepID=A0AA35PYC0_9HYPO|nr:unnamed protein product [Clonostachys chloroleuca]